MPSPGTDRCVSVEHLHFPYVTTTCIKPQVSIMLGVVVWRLGVYFPHWTSHPLQVSRVNVVILFEHSTISNDACICSQMFASLLHKNCILNILDSTYCDNEGAIWNRLERHCFTRTFILPEVRRDKWADQDLISARYCWHKNWKQYLFDAICRH